MDNYNRGNIIEKAIDKAENQLLQLKQEMDENRQRFKRWGSSENWDIFLKEVAVLIASKDEEEQTEQLNWG